MGINPNALRFLFCSKPFGVDLTKIPMIGRQVLHLSFNKFSSIITRELNYKLNTFELKELYNSGYCEEDLNFLVAEAIHSFDYSDYEGSTNVHDFNQPVQWSFSKMFTHFNEHNLRKELFS